MRSSLLLTAALTLVLSTATSLFAVGDTKETELKVVQADDAAEQDGKDCIVEFKVNGGRLLKDRGMCFLNSLSDHRDKKCFTAVIRNTGLKAFSEEKIEDPFNHFKDKKIRVKGKVAMFQDRPQIIVEDVGQIEEVKE